MKQPCFCVCVCVCVCVCALCLLLCVPKRSLSPADACRRHGAEPVCAGRRLRHRGERRSCCGLTAPCHNLQLLPPPPPPLRLAFCTLLAALQCRRTRASRMQQACSGINVSLFRCRPLQFTYNWRMALVVTGAAPFIALGGCAMRGVCSRDAELCRDPFQESMLRGPQHKARRGQRCCTQLSCMHAERRSAPALQAAQHEAHDRREQRKRQGVRRGQPGRHRGGRCHPRRAREAAGAYACLWRGWGGLERRRGQPPGHMYHAATVLLSQCMIISSPRPRLAAAGLQPPGLRRRQLQPPAAARQRRRAQDVGRRRHLRGLRRERGGGEGRRQGGKGERGQCPGCMQAGRKPWRIARAWGWPHPQHPLLLRRAPPCATPRKNCNPCDARGRSATPPCPQRCCPCLPPTRSSRGLAARRSWAAAATSTRSSRWGGGPG